MASSEIHNVRTSSVPSVKRTLSWVGHSRSFQVILIGAGRNPQRLYCRNAQLMPTLFLKLTKIWQRVTAISSISATHWHWVTEPQVWRRPGKILLFYNSAFWPFKVIQGQWFWYQSKARTVCDFLYRVSRLPRQMMTRTSISSQSTRSDVSIKDRETRHLCRSNLCQKSMPIDCIDDGSYSVSIQPRGILTSTYHR